MDKIVGQKDFAFRKLIAFADLKTERQCYTKGDVNVVIDSTDWGHRVGEIEIVVPDRDQVIQATKKIEDLGRELGNEFLSYFFFYFFPLSCFLVR